MSKYLIAFVLGIVTATVGFQGIARLADRGVDAIKTNTQELVK